MISIKLAIFRELTQSIPGKNLYFISYGKWNFVILPIPKTLKGRILMILSLILVLNPKTDFILNSLQNEPRYIRFWIYMSENFQENEISCIFCMDFDHADYDNSTTIAIQVDGIAPYHSPRNLLSEMVCLYWSICFHKK